MNLQQYANHRKALGLRGTSHVAVLKAIQAGRLAPPAVTRKGRGYPPAEADPVRYHGVGRFDPAKGLPASSDVGAPSYSDVFGDWACAAAASVARVSRCTTSSVERSSSSLLWSRAFL